MRGLGNPDSKIYAVLNKLTLLMELNLLVVLCCLPVITAGAALSSMHAVLLKIYRNEEKRVVSDFFQAFKSNLKNGTVLWVLFLFGFGLLTGLGLTAVRTVPDEAVFVVFVLLILAVLGVLYLSWALILQSRYVYTIPQCLKYALLAWLKYPGSTFVYLISAAIPVMLCCYLPLLPFVIFLGITLPQFISTTLYSRVFDQMEGVPARLPKL